MFAHTERTTLLKYLKIILIDHQNNYIRNLSMMI